MEAGDRLLRMQDWLRFLVGLTVLGIVGVFGLGSPASILSDLIGMTGLGLAVGLGFLTPRRYLRTYFWVMSLYFFAMALYWLLVPAKSPLYWLAFGFVSLLMAFCAREIGRREGREEPTESSETGR